MFVQILLNGLISGSLYALVALGFSLIYSSTRIFHIAHGAIYTASVYLFLAAFLLFDHLFSDGSSLTFIMSLLLSFLSVVVLSYLLEKVIYRPLLNRKTAPLVTFITSLGIYIIIVNLIALFFGNETKILSSEIEPSIELVGAIITRIQIIQFIVSLIIIISVFYLLSKTSLGRNIRALSDNSVLLNVIGIDINRIRVVVFIIGSLLASTASLLKAFDVGFDPYIGLSIVLTAAVAVIIGGVGVHIGAVVGALFIGITQNIVIWFTSAQWQDAVTFLILLIVLIVRREGLFAVKLRLEEQ